MSNTYRTIGPINDDHFLAEDSLQYILRRTSISAPTKSVAYFADQGREGLRRHLRRRGVELSQAGEQTLSSIPPDADLRDYRRGKVLRVGPAR